MIIDCKKIEQKIMETTKEWLKLKDTPTLAIVSCGLDEPSKIYVRNKIEKCKQLGIKVVHYMESNYDDCVITIEELNKDDSITAIMLQLPTKLNSADERELLEMIDVNKDVDGLSTASKMRHVLGLNLPCTSMAVLDIIEEYCGTDLSGKRVALYGRSDLVNKPLIQTLINRDATVTVYHSESPIDNVLDDSDISVVAIGRPRYFKIKDTGKEQLIIDVGINRDEHGKLCGDVDTRGYAYSQNIQYTPVPKGVGILTTSVLCYKVAKMAKHKKAVL